MEFKLSKLDRVESVIFGLKIYVMVGFITMVCSSIYGLIFSDSVIPYFAAGTLAMFTPSTLAFFIPLIQGPLAKSKREALIVGGTTTFLGQLSIIFINIFFTIFMGYGEYPFFHIIELNNLTFILIPVALIGAFIALVSHNTLKDYFVRPEITDEIDKPYNAEYAFDSVKQKPINPEKHYKYEVCPECGDLTLKLFRDGSAICEKCEYIENRDSFNKDNKG